MREHLRASGIEAIGDIAWGTHFCQLYQTREELVDTFAPYFKAGLENSEACLWIISEYLAENEAEEKLRRIIPDLENFIKQGQIEIIPYNQFYFEDGNFDSKKALKYLSEKLGNAIKKRYTGLRFAEDTGWLEKKDWDFFVDFEKKMDEITSNCRIIALCGYRLNKCGASKIIDIVMNHKSVLIKKGKQWRLIESPKRKEIEQALASSVIRRFLRLFEKARTELVLSPLSMKNFMKEGKMIPLTFLSILKNLLRTFSRPICLEIILS